MPTNPCSGADNDTQFAGFGSRAFAAGVDAGVLTFTLCLCGVAAYYTVIRNIPQALVMYGTDDAAMALRSRVSLAWLCWLLGVLVIFWGVASRHLTRTGQNFSRKMADIYLVQADTLRPPTLGQLAVRGVAHGAMLLPPLVLYVLFERAGATGWSQAAFWLLLLTPALTSLRVLWHPRRQTWPDSIARTVVVYPSVEMLRASDWSVLSRR